MNYERDADKKTTYRVFYFFIFLKKLKNTFLFNY